MRLNITTAPDGFSRYVLRCGARLRARPHPPRGACVGVRARRGRREAGRPAPLRLAPALAAVPRPAAAAGVAAPARPPRGRGGRNRALRPSSYRTVGFCLFPLTPVPPGAQSFGDWLIGMACKDSTQLGAGYEDVLKSGEPLKATGKAAPAKKAAPVRARPWPPRARNAGSTSTPARRARTRACRRRRRSGAAVGAAPLLIQHCSL